MEIILLIPAAIAPFTFTFCLIHAIKHAVNDGPNDIAYGLGAGFSLLVLIAACILS